MDAIHVTVDRVEAHSPEKSVTIASGTLPAGDDDQVRLFLDGGSYERRR